MIETKNPAINVSELMSRVRAKAAELARRGDTVLPRRTAAALPVRPTLPPASLPLPRPLDTKKDRILKMLEEAHASTEVSSWIPKPLRRFFRKQGGYNRLIRDALVSMAKTNAELASRLQQLTRVVEAQDRSLRATVAVTRNLEGWEERLTSDNTYIKGELSYLRASLRDGATAVKTDASEPAPTPGRLDAFYVAFEDRFRGSRHAITERLRSYLPDLAACGAGTAERPVVDLGCGRGEWLELLRENGLAAHGADMNHLMVATCKERGLDVRAGDAVSFLRSLPDNSQGAVTAFHMIEHLPLEVLVELVSESYRVLKPGGLALFESPNCKSVIVGACNFYSDPTHRNPVFPDTAAFILELHGFARPEIRYLRPVEGSPFSRDDAGSALLDGWFYGPRDFAVIGHKAAA